MTAINFQKSVNERIGHKQPVFIFLIHIITTPLIGIITIIVTDAQMK